MKKHLILTYKLKPGILAADFEQWVKTIDQPTMRGLGTVSSFQTFRTEALLIGDKSPSHNYIEVFEINDFEAFTTKDMASEIVQNIMGSFMEKVDGVEFNIASEV